MSGGMGLLGTLSLAALIGACGGDADPVRPREGGPPAVAILEPANGAEIRTSRPTFSIRVSDTGTGVFCSTLRATVDGVDLSRFFLSGCDETAGLVRVGGQVLLEDGAHDLVFRISDRAGNEAVASSSFTVNSVGLPPRSS